MRDCFVKNNLPPDRYASCAEVLQVLIDFVSRFAKLKAGMPKAFLASSLTRLASCALNSCISSSSTIATAPLVAVTTVLFQITKWANGIFSSLDFC